MRIALFFNTPSGGAKRAIFEWTHGLANQHTIDAYTLSTANHQYCDIRPFVQQYHVFDFSARRLLDSPFGRLNQLNRWRDLGDLIYIGQRIAYEINAGEYDIVFANTCLYTFIPTFLPWIKIPAIYYLHEPFGSSFIRRFTRPYLRENQWRSFLNHFDPFIWLYTRRLETIQQESIRHTKRLLANSRFTQEQMKIGFRVETEVCHYGVDDETFRPMPHINKENFVISVGELSPRKGFDFIIKSLGQIPIDKRPKLKIVCNIIQEPEKAYIVALASHYQVNLEIVTNLDSQQLAIEYNKACLCLYAPVLEPFGLVPLEAMACGTPVVGVCEGGIQESICHQQTGLLVERDLTQFASAIQYLLANQALIFEYSRNARKHILDNWTWDKSLRILESHLALCARMA
ncbi:MAG: glycosyltransferase [Caldilinea sp. CFX5]|nr:glycosyltransferase [Caldilinea sp. CFX5]